jgi:hypothetical protein
VGDGHECIAFSTETAALSRLKQSFANDSRKNRHQAGNSAQNSTNRKTKMCVTGQEVANFSFSFLAQIFLIFWVVNKRKKMKGKERK